MDLVPSEPEPSIASERRGPSQKYSTHIAQAETVVLGDRNIVSIVDSITISDFLNAVEREIETGISESDQKQSALEKVKELSKNPLIASVLAQSVGQFLRGAFGQ